MITAQAYEDATNLETISNTTKSATFYGKV